MAFTGQRGDEEDRVTGDCHCDCKEICSAFAFSDVRHSENVQVVRLCPQSVKGGM